MDRNRNGMASTFNGRDEIADQGHVGPVEVDRAGPGLFDGLLFLAELTGVKHLDLVAAAAALGDQGAHVAQRLDGRVILGLGVGGAKFARAGARRPDGEHKRDVDHPGPREFGTAQHWHTNPSVVKSMAGAKGSMQSKAISKRSG